MQWRCQNLKQVVYIRFGRVAVSSKLLSSLSRSQSSISPGLVASKPKLYLIFITDVEKPADFLPLSISWFTVVPDFRSMVWHSIILLDNVLVQIQLGRIINAVTLRLM